MEPNLQIVREGVEIKTNSNGFRDTDFSGEPKPGEFLIAVLGDSFVFGQGVPQTETMPVILQKILNKSSKDPRFRVWNLGVSGYNTEQEAYLLKSFALPRKPNWVVVGYNINDCEPIGVDPSSVKKEERGEKPLMNSLVKFLQQPFDNTVRKTKNWKFDSSIRLYMVCVDLCSRYFESIFGPQTTDGTKVSDVVIKMKIECDRPRSWFYCSHFTCNAELLVTIRSKCG